MMRQYLLNIIFCQEAPYFGEQFRFQKYSKFGMALTVYE
jgi:hypothetical protein